MFYLFNMNIEKRILILYFFAQLTIINANLISLNIKRVMKSNNINYYLVLLLENISMIKF